MQTRTVLELYSGIGGLHYSVLQAFINYLNESQYNDFNITDKKTNIHKICEEEQNINDIVNKTDTPMTNTFENAFQFFSLDLNPNANETYYHNFKENCIYLNDKKSINIFFKNICMDKLYKQKKNIFDLNRENEDVCYNAKGIDNVHTSADTTNSDNNKNYIIQMDINNLTVDFFEHHKFYMLLMSNPCQPYTRLNHKFKQIDLNLLFSEYSIGEKCIESSDQKDVIQKNVKKTDYITATSINNSNKKIDEKNTKNNLYHVNNLNIEKAVKFLNKEKDTRSNSFIHVCNLLQNIKKENLPEYIFIENVKNFEISYSFLYFLNSIKSNYNFKTYLLSPLQFGIPNERLRFYCICKKKKKEKDVFSKSTINNKKIYTSAQIAGLYNNSLKPTTFLSFKNILKKKEATFYTPSLITYLDQNEHYVIPCYSLKNINMYNNKLNNF
ncbi:DNA (cytosine-5)-methyltransferase, partial [Hepatocystis sp. ex Piliocolobus tephrosceles]